MKRLTTIITAALVLTGCGLTPRQKVIVGSFLVTSVAISTRHHDSNNAGPAAAASLPIGPPVGFPNPGTCTPAGGCR